MKIKFINGSTVTPINTINSSRGRRSNILYLPLDETPEYKYLYNISQDFRILVHKAKYSKKKRVRNKYINMITKKVIWFNHILKGR